MLIRAENLSRSYPGGVNALRGASLSVADGEFIAITGASGCGKSTLLHLLGALDTADSGELWAGELGLHAASETERTAYRRHQVGIVFQFFNLMPAMTLTENVALPLQLGGTKKRTAAEGANALLELVGLADRRGHFPHQLSGGEMQRAAVARALVVEPGLLLADEPTGNLDSANAELVLDLFREVHSKKLATMVIVTHSEEVAEAAERRVRMADGQVVV